MLLLYFAECGDHDILEAELFPHKFRCWNPNPRTSECDSIWSHVVETVIFKSGDWDLKIGGIRALAWTLSWSDWCSYKKTVGHTQRYQGCVYRGEAKWGDREKMTLCTPRREISGETSPAHTLILDFQPPGLRENKYLLFEPLELWEN